MSADTENQDLDPGDRDFAKRLAATLSESAETLDGATRSALTRARFAALGQAQRPARFSWRGWAPAGVVAMALLTVWFYGGLRPGPLAVPLNSVEDLALVSDADGFDLSGDSDMDLDLEFYEWAAATGGLPGSGLGS